MSLSRSTCQEMLDFITNKPSAVLGNKFFDVRTVIYADVSYKKERFEPHIFVISKFRVFLLVGKSPSSLKVDKSFHLLTMSNITITGDDELSITIDEAGSRRKVTLRGNSAETIATHLLTAIKHYFPDIGPVLPSLVELHPPSLYQTFHDIILEISPRPCHSFRRSYAALCDYFDQPYREEVSWDVEKIYTLNRVRDLRIEDFSHLLPKDLLPIVGVLQYSSYFSGIAVDGLRIPADLVDVILSVLRRSHWLTNLHLINCGLPKDFITLFTSAVSHNSNLPLESIDFSRNVFDDKKGFHSIASVFPRLTTLREITLNDCALTDKCCSLLCSALYGALSPTRNSSSMQLHKLSLVKNTIGTETSSLVNLVSLCSSLRILDITDTQFALDKLWPALKYGGLQLEKLIVAGCSIGAKKAVADSLQPVKEFFSMAVNLDEIVFSNTLLPSDVLKAMLLGLASNQQLRPFVLTLNGCLDKGGSSVLETCLAGVAARELSLRDNNMESEMLGVVSTMSTMAHLRKLDIGGCNVTGLRRSNKQSHSQTINKILLEVVKLIGDQGKLEELIVSDARLGAHLSVLLNTLGATSCLKTLDISSNEMGNFGARILSKALQLNVSLKTLLFDSNHITAEGFADIASAMIMNKTLVTVPYPSNDAFDANGRADKHKASTALLSIEKSLERNRSLYSPEDANYRRAAFSLHQNSENPSADSLCAAEDFLANGREGNPLPLRIIAQLEGLVQQIGASMSDHINQTLLNEGIDEGSIRVEKIATDRLREMITRDAQNVLSEWKWRVLLEKAESMLRGGGVSSGSIGATSVGSPSLASPRAVPRSQMSHRPRSIVVTDLHSPAEESGVNLDSPPKPSALTHVAKSRPRIQRRGPNKGMSGSASTPSDEMSRSISEALVETDEDGQSIQSNEGAMGDSIEVKKPLSDRPVFRAAMIPDASATLLTQVQLKPVGDRLALSPKAESILSVEIEKNVDNERESPAPPLPRRNKPVMGLGINNPNPPIRPPKPELYPRVGTILASVSPPSSTPQDSDDSNANNRRSVADMARMFQK